MIVLAQHWTPKRVVEALWMQPHEGGLWHAFIGSYDPAKGETVAAVEAEGRSRYAGTGTIQTTLTWGISHLAAWSAPEGEQIALKTFADRLNEFMSQVTTNLEALLASN